MKNKGVAFAVAAAAGLFIMLAGVYIYSDASPDEPGKSSGKNTEKNSNIKEFCGAIDERITSAHLHEDPQKYLYRKVCLYGKVARRGPPDRERSTYLLKTDYRDVLISHLKPQVAEDFFEVSDNVICAGYPVPAENVRDFFDFLPYIYCEFAHSQKVEPTFYNLRFVRRLESFGWQRCAVKKENGYIDEIWTDPSDKYRAALKSDEKGVREAGLYFVYPEDELDRDIGSRIYNCRIFLRGAFDETVAEEITDWVEKVILRSNLDEKVAESAFLEGKKVSLRHWSYTHEWQLTVE